MGRTLLVLGLQLLLCLGTTRMESQQCRDRNGYMDQLTYDRSTCASCFFYLFQTEKELVQWPKDDGMNLVAHSNGTNYPRFTSITPDIHNGTLRDMVCKVLNGDECERWTDCCMAASKCCQRQMSAQAWGSDSPHCPRTWDGYGCWDDTIPDIEVTINCPSFIPHAIPTVYAFKICTENGTWRTHEDTGKEWTDYTKCFNMEDIKLSIYISLACNAASLLLLIPAIIIFLVYRILRSQHRIRLHINLFASFVMSNVIYIMWDVLVVYDRLQKESGDSVMRRNTPGCKFLYVLTRYSRSTNYLWMFFEGYYLHRLIANAFEPPKSLLPFYIIGWGFPWIPVGIYSILRIFKNNESCWVSNIGPFEWLIYVPNLLSLAMNLFFLINILRILLTQLQSHPKEPSHFRRALKATFVLIPLFGTQLLFIIYRPPPSAPGGKEYELISSVVTNSQGFFVALIFCFLNGEVHSMFRRTADKCCPSLQRRSSRRSFSMTTQVTMTTEPNYGTKENHKDVPKPHTRGSGNKNSYIPLKVVKSKEANGEPSAVDFSETTTLSSH